MLFHASNAMHKMQILLSIAD